MANVFLGCPTYDGTMSALTARGMFATASERHRVYTAVGDFSLVSLNCNRLWCMALNTRQANDLQWFAMLHADIGPERWWVDKLIAEAERCNADLLSAVVPIKDAEGLTSTAILKPGGPLGGFVRLTMSQVRHPSFPDTFDVQAAVERLAKLPEELRLLDLPREALLVNTGCMVMRLDRPWADERLWFDDLNGIVRINGELTAICKSEDWNFSHRVAQLGGKVMATRIVKLTHRGVSDYSSDQVWGKPRDVN
ncbi:MAG TPA: hypothetical protein VGI40_22335 [Pirellulaceae bacterium]|jgi:hypothetical protein